jgi:phage terminase large subunit-like protein
MTSPAVLEALPLAAARMILERQREQTAPRWTPLPHQIPPEGDWDTWLLLAGRFAGKTDACAHYVDQEARRSPIRIGIIAPTLGDAVDSCVNGPSGLRAHNPSVKLVQRTGGTYVEWPNGSVAKLFGAHSPEDVERLRAGGNRHLDWYEEFAAWRHAQDTLDQAALGLRLGARPHAVASTTPKPRPHLLKVMDDPSTVITRAASADNPHIDPKVRAKLYATYGGTRLGRQELYAEILGDVPGALWTRERLEANRVTEHPPLHRIVVGVDPEAASGEDSAETGIVVVGAARVGDKLHGYVLDDLTIRGTPGVWGKAAVTAYHKHLADRLIGEVNNGGEMVGYVIRTVPGGERVTYKAVHASRGKQARAEPVAGLDEQGRLHLVGYFPELEDQLCSWVPGAEKSPDRLDALVWAATEVLLGGTHQLESLDPDLASALVDYVGR